MTQSDLQTLLRDHVTADEPPFLASLDTTLARGRRTRRLRSGAVALSAAAVLGVGAVGVHALPGHDHVVMHESGFAGAPGTLGQHLLDTSSAAFGRTVPDLPAGRLTAYGSDHASVAPGSTSAQYVYARYALSGGHALRVGAAGVAAGDLTQLGDWCTQGLGAQEFSSCTLTHLPDGSTEVVSVGPVGALQPDDSYPVLTLTHPDTPDADVFFQRQVSVVDGSAGVRTTASEIVHAATPAAAGAAWSVSVDTLRGLAEDPDLADYDLPASPAPSALH